MGERSKKRKRKNEVEGYSHTHRTDGAKKERSRKTQMKK